MNYTVPRFKADAFHCPFCATFSHMHWNRVFTTEPLLFAAAQCSKCHSRSIWSAEQGKTYSPYIPLEELVNGVMIYPDSSIAPEADVDMPADVKRDYEEAARIFSRSPRGAAALLRLGLQKLCKHLGEPGKNIDTDIRSLAAKNTLPPMIIKVADTLRITGNNAVHPGEMSDEDFDQVAEKMFDLLNFIVKKGISEPKELQALYEKTPERLRKAAEDKDAKNKAV
ncbi:DUF4145 domain-containing protein [Chitinibacter sp. GC72]|uniref:DUF4145 domain-containing protein n=1 Tax=Chitinibacter sp. GC72 TaxID=1526917 RepID=UPI0012F9E788|nr:DUF4145 domain-containing protein [Chitinibacter sp. GC72]